MPRPRTPEAKAALTGALANHPERFKARNTPKASAPLGDPPAFLSKEEKAAWKMFDKEWSWLTNQDRPAMIALSQMQAELEKPEPKGAAFYTAYRLLVSEFGGTPTSRSKVFQPKEDEPDDPFAAFGNRAN